MKKEELQNSQQNTGGAENRNSSRDEQKNPATNVSDNQQNDTSHQAGLGRDRMTDIEDLGGLSGRDNYEGDNDDLNNETLNAANDQ